MANPRLYCCVVSSYCRFVSGVLSMVCCQWCFVSGVLSVVCCATCVAGILSDNGIAIFFHQLILFHQLIPFHQLILFHQLIPFHFRFFYRGSKRRAMRGVDG